MRNSYVLKLIQLMRPLSPELKFELLTEISNKLKKRNKKNDKKNKEAILNKLYGAWKDTDSDLIKEIYESRSNSERKVEFD